MAKKMKAQFKAADRNGATCTIIIGEDELANEQAVIRHMVSGEQKTVAYQSIVTELGESIKGGSES